MVVVTPWKKLQDRVKQYSMFLIGSFVLNIMLLLVTAYSISHKTVIVQIPPVPLKDTIVISKGEANKAFFETWGKYIIAIAGTYSPESIDDSKYTLLQRVHPDHYFELSNELGELAEHVKKNRVRQAFYPNWKKASMEIRGSYARWVVPGKAVKEVGSSREEEPMQYIVKMMADGIGGFFLIDIGKKEGK